MPRRSAVAQSAPSRVGSIAPVRGWPISWPSTASTISALTAQPAPYSPAAAAVEDQIAAQRDSYAAASIARAETADNGATISIERTIDPPRSPEPEPFGLDAEPVAVGAIVAKWSGVEAEIRAEDEILERCREG